MTTTQPTPGQHVYVEAVAEQIGDSFLLRPVSSDPSRAYRGVADPDRCRWRPMPDETTAEASDPPARILSRPIEALLQQVIKAQGHVANTPTVGRPDGPAHIAHGMLTRIADGLRDMLATIHGGPAEWQPGDPIYTEEPPQLPCPVCGATWLRQPGTPETCPDCGWTPGRVDDSPTAPLADVPGPDDSTPTPAAKLLEEIFTGGSDESQPSGDGAALIAATERETAPNPNPDQWTPMIDVLAAERDAWEDTARRLAGLVDDRDGPVQATTHGEAGKAQAGAQAVRFCSADGRLACPRHTPNCLPGCATVPDALAAPEPLTLDARADAAKWRRLAEDLAAENARLRQQRDDLRPLLPNALQLVREALAGEPEPGGGIIGICAAIDGLREQRDEARRELEQLRGELAQIVGDWQGNAAQAITAPATQDGQADD